MVMVRVRVRVVGRGSWSWLGLGSWVVRLMVRMISNACVLFLNSQDNDRDRILNLES